MCSKSLERSFALGFGVSGEVDYIVTWKKQSRDGLWEYHLRNLDFI